MDKMDQENRDELAGFRELVDYIRSGMLLVWPERYGNIRVHDMAKFIRVQHDRGPQSAWMLQLADALGCFWNPAVLADREGSGAGSAMATGFAAVEQRLRELAADQALVVGTDVDEIALAVARRFTPDNEPQRRARLQVAIVTAISVANNDCIPVGYTLVDDGELRRLRERAALPLRIEAQELWHWQGEGHDAPESLACPVIMSADTLRELLRRRPLAWQGDAAAILRHAAATLQNWEGDPDETGYLGDFGDAVAILEAMAEHAPSQHWGLVHARQLAENYRDHPQLTDEWRPSWVAMVDKLTALIDGPAPPAKPAKPEVRRIRIEARNNLDPITVFIEEFGDGRGHMVVTCYAHAWSAFWGAMGDRTLLEFVASCSADYIGNSMTSGTTSTHKKREQDYADRVAAEVIAEAKAILAGEVTHG